MKEFRVGQPISVGNVTLTPIVKVELYYAWTTEAVVWVSKEPIAVLMSGPGGNFAASVTSGELQLMDLLECLSSRAEDTPGHE